MFSESVLVKVEKYSGSTSTDKNGKQTVFLVPLAGKIPNEQRTIAGSVAENMGLTIGKIFLVKFTAVGEDINYGTQFNRVNMGEISPIQALEVEKQLGAAELVSFPKPEGYKHDRSTNSVESGQRLRQRAGLYNPYVKTSTSHANAKEIRLGSSAEGALAFTGRKALSDTELAALGLTKDIEKMVTEPIGG